MEQMYGSKTSELDRLRGGGFHATPRPLYTHEGDKTLIV